MMRIFDVIKFEGTNDILAWKFPGEDFTTMSKLIVHESQEAYLFKDGQIADVFQPGSYTMETRNIPILNKLINIPFDGHSPFHCEVYFINKVISMDVLWGTSTPIQINDPIYNIILPIRAHGQFAVQVKEPKKLLLKLVGTIREFDQATLVNYFRGILMTNIKDYIAKQFVREHISVLEIHSHLREVSEGISKDLENQFEEYGIALINFTVNEIAPPEDDPSYLTLKNAMARKAEMQVLGTNYQQEKQYEIYGKIASNEGAGIMMAPGVGVGMGITVGSTLGNAMAEDLTAQGTVGNQSCRKCGHKIPAGAKFCLQCGARVEEMSICPSCGRELPVGAKFCYECGAKLEAEKMCPVCQAKLAQGAKFCPECGTRLEET